MEMLIFWTKFSGKVMQFLTFTHNNFNRDRNDSTNPILKPAYIDPNFSDFPWSVQTMENCVCDDFVRMMNIWYSIFIHSMISYTKMFSFCVT